MEGFPNAERRKQVRLRLRSDLVITKQKYEGKTCHVVKDPVSLRYYRFNEREYYVLQMFDGTNTLEDVQKAFEKQFKPDRLTLEDLESFSRQLVTTGLVQNESPAASKHLYRQQQKQRMTKRVATMTNILYLKIPVFDPDRILAWMYKYLWWMFSYWFLFLSVAFMFAAVGLVTIHFDTFYEKLPAYHEFFQFRTLLYMWIALGAVKIIHEFGHGLSCKAFGGECHEMGFLLLCFSPAMYCNVTDSWTVADKWKRIIISFAGIYVELIIAAISTFVWWYTPHLPFINNIALCLMTLCSISTFVFNANPLMRFDGYYIMADWLEIPNLRDRSNRYLKNIAAEKCLGIESQPEPYMATGRKILFVSYAVLSWFYRWFVTFSILFFMFDMLKPYKLEVLSRMLALMSLGTMFFWPLFRFRKNLKTRGRLPDMKMHRVLITASFATAFVLAFFLLPLPVSRIMETGLVQVQEKNISRVYLQEPGYLEKLTVRDGEWVVKNQLLAVYRNPKLENELAEVQAQMAISEGRIRAVTSVMADLRADPNNNGMLDLQAELNQAQDQFDLYAKREQTIKRQLASLSIKAPRDGYVMTPPKPDEVGKLWDKGVSEPFCSVGDPKRVRVLVPVDPTDYRLLREDLAKRDSLDVSIHIPGRMDHIYHGRVEKLPETDAKNVPIQLTHRGGGSLAVKPNSDPNVIQPLAQTYLIPVEISDPDGIIVPGTLAEVKIHTAWRSTAWYVWRGIATALDLGLL